MGYTLVFGDLLPYWDVLLHGLIFTIVLTAVSTVAGIALGTAGASARAFGPKWTDWLVGAYVELDETRDLLATGGAYGPLDLDVTGDRIRVLGGDTAGVRIAGFLAAADVVADAREAGFRVRPVCSYVVKAFEKHPDWADIAE